MNIESLLDELEDILDEGKSMPFTSNLLVDVNEIKRVLEDIRLNMPDELMQARKIASERKEILTAAQNSADEIIAAAHKRAKELVAEHEITKGAEISAADIMAQARTQAGEIVEELVFGARRIGRLPDNLVFMGIGEGLLNLDELLRAIALIVSPEGFGMSPRRLTVSTSGIVPGIRRLAEFGRELTLAVSLHAVNDELRARLIPDGFRYPVREILAAMDEYRERAGRMVTLEYTLLDGVNDSPADARELARIGREHHAKINLIPYNATDAAFRRPPRRVMEEFFRTVEQCGGRVTMRQERGSSRTAACGQLRRRHAEKRETSSECE